VISTVVVVAGAAAAAQVGGSGVAQGELYNPYWQPRMNASSIKVNLLEA